MPLDDVSILERFEAERMDPTPEAGIRFEAAGGVMRLTTITEWVLRP